jgi:lipopolysaccharide-binding protein
MLSDPDFRPSFLIAGLLSLICLYSSGVAATNPGLKLRLSQPGLNYAGSVAVQIMSDKIHDLRIPDQTGTAHVEVGKVEYEIRNIRLTSFQPPSTSVTVNPGSGITWSLSGAALSIHGDWHYKYRLGFIQIQDSGSFDGSGSGISISVSVAIGASSTGQPTISSNACSCVVNQLDIKIHGGASFFYNLFMGSVENPIRKNLQGKICDAARDAINTNAARELATLQLKVLIEKEWLLDYSLVSAPMFAAGFLESMHKGEFFFVNDPTEAPFQPAPLPSPPTADHMVTFWMSEYVLNTVGLVMQKHGILAYNLTKKDLPDDQKEKLNTTCSLLSGCIGVAFPTVGKLYPNSSVEIEMYSTAAPSASINTADIVGTFDGIMVLRTRLTNGSLAHLFGIKVSAKVSITPKLDGKVLKATLDTMDEAMSVVDSSIGPVSTVVFQLFFDVVKKGFIIPKLNEAGAKGFPLPSIQHVEFINTGLSLQPNCVSVTTDVRYKPVL